MQNLNLLHGMMPEFLDRGFGPTGMSATSVLRQCDEIKRQIKYEEAILRRLPECFQEAQEARIQALEAMLRQSLEAAQTLRRMAQPEVDPSFAGYHIGDRVLVTQTGGIEGTIKAVTPMFEPTHLVVLMDNGYETTVRPDRLRPIRES